MRRVLLIFIDGLGLGADSPATNPLVRFDPGFFRKLLGRSLTAQAAPYLSDTVCLVAADASLGVEGLPQSATGQTALFTGVNAPAELGRHIQGFPGPALTEIINCHGIMAELVRQGYTATSANMYGGNYMDQVARRKRRHSATTLTILAAGQRLRSEADARAGQAVYQDITNEMLPLFGIDDVPTVTPAVAGRRLAELALAHNFTMFEYFQTDSYGHKKDWDAAQRIVGVLDEFLAAVYQAANKELLVIVTSDHGNFEDFTVKTHTRNAVPVLLWGPGCRPAAAKIRDLTDIKPVIVEYLKEGETIG